MESRRERGGNTSSGYAREPKAVYLDRMCAEKGRKKGYQKNTLDHKMSEEAGPEEVLGLDVTPESASGVTDADVSRLQDEPNIRPYLVQK